MIRILLLSSDMCSKLGGKVQTIQGIGIHCSFTVVDENTTEQHTEGEDPGVVGLTSLLRVMKSFCIQKQQSSAKNLDMTYL